MRNSIGKENENENKNENENEKKKCIQHDLKLCSKKGKARNQVRLMDQVWL